MFSRRPQTFLHWFVLFLATCLIYPFLWKTIADKIWTRSDFAASLFVLLLESVGEALIFSLFFYLFFPSSSDKA
jgi:hypothetical protein